MKLRELIREGVRQALNEGMHPGIPSQEILDLLKADYPVLDDKMLQPEDLAVSKYDLMNPTANSWVVVIDSMKMGFIVDLNMNDVENIGYRQADEMVHGEDTMFR